MIGVSVDDTTLGTTVANLGMTDVRFAKPVFQGDTLHLAVAVLEKRESRSRPDAGIVVFEHRPEPARRGSRPLQAPSPDGKEAEK